MIIIKYLSILRETSQQDMCILATEWEKQVHMPVKVMYKYTALIAKSVKESSFTPAINFQREGVGKRAHGTRCIILMEEEASE